MTISDPYAALNLPHSATSLQIKTSYRQLARKFHPDTWSQPCFSEADKKEATLKFAEISNAYALLSDADEKAEYDRTYRLGGYDNTTNNAGSRTTHNNNNNNPQRNGRPCHTAAPPPPPPPSSPQRTSTVHWASAIDPVTRRRYYYNKQTGECSWELPTHTAAATGTTTKTNNNTHDDHDDFGYQEMHQDQAWQQGRQQQQQDTSYYGRRIDSHQCESFVALVLCPPIGLIAMYHSFRADRCRRQGLYNEAFHHARQAPKYSCLAKVIGVGFWIYYYIVVVRENDIEWPDFDFDFGDWGDRRRKE